MTLPPAPLSSPRDDLIALYLARFAALRQALRLPDQGLDLAFAVSDRNSGNFKSGKTSPTGRKRERLSSWEEPESAVFKLGWHPDEVHDLACPEAEPVRPDMRTPRHTREGVVAIQNAALKAAAIIAGHRTIPGGG